MILHSLNFYKWDNTNSHNVEWIITKLSSTITISTWIYFLKILYVFFLAKLISSGCERLNNYSPMFNVWIFSSIKLSLLTPKPEVGILAYSSIRFTMQPSKSKSSLTFFLHTPYLFRNLLIIAGIVTSRAPTWSSLSWASLFFKIWPKLLDVPTSPLDWDLFEDFLIFPESLLLAVSSSQSTRSTSSSWSSMLLLVSVSSRLRSLF